MEPTQAGSSWLADRHLSFMDDAAPHIPCIDCHGLFCEVVFIKMVPPLHPQSFFMDEADIGMRGHFQPEQCVVVMNILMYSIRTQTSLGIERATVLLYHNVNILLFFITLCVM